MFGGEGGEFPEESPIERFNRQHRQNPTPSPKPTTVLPKLTTVLPTPTPVAPKLTTVLTELPPGWDAPKMPNKQWSDTVIEPVQPLFEQQKGQVWFVKLPGAVSLVEMEILDITLKTVLVQSSRRYGQSARYARTDIEFVERVDA